MKATHAILILFLLIGCKAKETTVERTKTSDTLVTKSFKYVSKPIETKYTFSIECDSLGNVKEIQTFESSGLNSASVKLENNRLDLRLITGQSERKRDSIVSISDSKIDNSKKTVIYLTPLWVWPTIILLLLIIGLLIKFK
jgi:uncharacterized protein YcfL